MDIVVIVGVFLICILVSVALGKLMSKTYPSVLLGNPWTILSIMFLVVPMGYFYFLSSFAGDSIVGRVLEVLLVINAGFQYMKSRAVTYFFDEHVTSLDKFIDHNFLEDEEITHAKIIEKIEKSTEKISIKDKRTLITMYNECPELMSFILKIRKNKIEKSDLIKIHDISKKLMEFRKKHKDF